MELIETYFGKLFHESGPKNCVPDCPAEIVPWFHPHAVFHAYFIGSKDCSIKAKQGLPFFTENYGPKWTEYTTVVHEIAGHHVEVWSCLSVCLLSSHHLLHLHLTPWTRLAHNASAFSPHPLLSCASILVFFTPGQPRCPGPLPLHCTSRCFWPTSLSLSLGGPMVGL